MNTWTTKRVLLTLFVASASIIIVSCSSTPAPKLPNSLNVTTFKPVQVSYQHRWNEDVAFPFSGGAAIDIDGDGRMEVFVSGGDGQDDALLRYNNGRMDNVIASTGLSSRSASYGATAVDFNNDGQTDLFVARNNGVWLYTNNRGVFSEQRIEYGATARENPLTIAVSDVDQDGDMDLYISNFINYKNWKSSVFNKPDLVGHNRLLRNDGGLRFTDITSTSGTGGTQNTFSSVFTDLDQDGFQDLVVSNNTGRIEIFHNNRNSTFTKNSYNSGLGYWMGIGVGDFDQDGDQDLALSNVSNSIPTRFVRGDLRRDQALTKEWVLLRNDGGRTFTNIAAPSGLTGHGFGWGMVFEDLNLDGKLDILAAQSYIKYPLHKIAPLSGRVMLQTADSTGRRFLNAPSLGLGNKHFGQSAIIADLDGDAKQDVVWVNMSGPTRAFLNQHQADVVTLAVPENARWLGARVTAISNQGSSYTREVNNGVGMQTDQSPHLSFAVPAGGVINSLQVRFADGSSKTIRVSGPGLVKP